MGENNEELICILAEDWIEKYELDFGKTPDVRLTQDEWYALLAAMALCFRISGTKYRMLPKSLQEKFTDIT